MQDGDGEHPDVGEGQDGGGDTPGKCFSLLMRVDETGKAPRFNKEGGHDNIVLSVSATSYRGADYQNGNQGLISVAVIFDDSNKWLEEQLGKGFMLTLTPAELPAVPIKGAEAAEKKAMGEDDGMGPQGRA